MDQCDIKYIMEILSDAVSNKDWDIVTDAMDALKEFLDDDKFSEDN